MSTLIVRHIPATGPPQFQVMEPGGKATKPAALPPAAGFAVAGRPDTDLMVELRWYLETFLEYPFPPVTERAERLREALRTWGRDAFNVLFGERDGAVKLARATAGGYEKLRLQVRSDEPRVLSWPWEALHDPKVGPLGQLSQVERCLDDLEDPPTVSAELPRDRVNILLVTARPFEGDVAYRSISRPLVEMVRDEKLPVHVRVLRPPSFERLREHLRERPRHYHILHFDGHGAYTTALPRGALSGNEPHVLDPHQLKGSEGRLVFEDDGGEPEPITAERLSPLLREHAVPIVVMNACQSGMVDEEAETAFASVAAALLRAGTRSVVAMAYSLYVSAAQVFLPAFYRRLFASGSVAEAVRAGRQQMFHKQGRVCVRGRFDLEDWIVPVLYQQEDVDLTFVAQAPVRQDVERPPLFELGGEASPHGFVGRDGAVLRLERALRSRPAGILIHGLGGVGKTTLARGFVEWLAETEGLGQGCFWLTFQDIRSSEYVLNRLGERLFGTQFAVLDAGRKIEKLAKALKEQPFVIVWDNFEVVAGIAGTSAHPALSDEDRGHLRQLLAALRGGATKVLITSRGEEAWLRSECRKVPLGGLKGEERWEYCGEILADLGLKVERKDQELGKLMDLLDGHPLAMRVVLPELERRRAAELIAAVQSNLAALDLPESEESAKLYATLGFAEEALDARLRPLLVPLAFHERFIDGNLLEAMAEQLESAPARAEIDALLHGLAGAGLLREVGQAVFEMHPALTGFLRSAVLGRTEEEERDRWARAFVDVMGSLANLLAPRPLHEQRSSFYLHGASFFVALEEAKRLEMDQHSLVQALGFFARNQRSFAEAAERFQELAELNRRRGEEGLEASAYHELGTIMHEQRDFVAAERWFRKSLKIKKIIGDEDAISSTYQGLGINAFEQRDLDAAENWFRKSLQLNEKLGNEKAAGAAYELGWIAHERREFDAAEQWYRKALQIQEKGTNKLHLANTYHQLGWAAQEQRDFDSAEQWYKKSLRIKEGISDEHGAAFTYHQLGATATEQRNFEAAEKWYRRSLQIKEKLGDDHGAALTYGDLGILAGEQRYFEESGRWLLKCVLSLLRLNDPRRAEGNAHSFMIFYSEAPPVEQQKLRTMWEEAGLPWPEDAAVEGEGGGTSE